MIPSSRTDSKGLQGKVTFNVNVTSGKGDAAVNASLNTWPQVSNLSASATALEVNESTTVSAIASDNDGNGQPIGGNTTGIVSICVGPKKTATFPPDITETFQSISSTSANGTVTFRVKAVDPQGSAMSFSWASNLGTTNTPTTTTDSSEVVWTAPSCTQTGVTPTITATVINAHGLSATQAFSVSGLPACMAIWSSTAAMSAARSLPTATLLPSGKVLVSGGWTGSLASAEVYDPATNSWSSVGSMTVGRNRHTATLLPSGKVLVTGGYNSGVPAELYNPVTNSWSSAGSMAAGRYYHAATLLPSGKVLITGGGTASAELYDPATNSWSSAGSMTASRMCNTATLLSSGKVLVTGGTGSGYLSTTEMYDPATNSWSSAGAMAGARECHTATLLSSGKVLVTGGFISNTSPLASTELYDPATNSWSSAGAMAVSRGFHTATLLNSGQVLIAGGSPNGYASAAISAAEFYTP